MRGLQALDTATLQKYDVNVVGQIKVTWQPLWDYQTYPLAGFTGPTLFFQVPQGNSGKTIEDTNMTQQGNLPSPINMLITGIEACAWPGVAPVRAAAAAPDVKGISNDMYALQNGKLSVKLTIGDATWLEEAPLGVFPPQFNLQGYAAEAFAQAAAADQSVQVDYAAFRGPMYQVIPLRLISSQNFVVSVNSPAAIALPSGVDARWGFRLHGYRYSLAQ